MKRLKDSLKKIIKLLLKLVALFFEWIAAVAFDLSAGMNTAYEANMRRKRRERGFDEVPMGKFGPIPPELMSDFENEVYYGRRW